MIKTLLQSQQNFSAQSTSKRVPPAVIPKKKEEATPMDLKVEQAIVDLQDLKTKMIDSQAPSMTKTAE